MAKYFCVDRVPKFKLYTANPAWTYSSPEELNGASYMGKVRLIEIHIPYTYSPIEQQQTEKIETEVRDVNRVRITKVYTCRQG